MQATDTNTLYFCEVSQVSCLIPLLPFGDLSLIFQDLKMLEQIDVKTDI